MIHCQEWYFTNTVYQTKDVPLRSYIVELLNVYHERGIDWLLSNVLSASIKKDNHKAFKNLVKVANDIFRLFFLQ